MSFIDLSKANISNDLSSITPLLNKNIVAYEHSVNKYF